jgi:hypothetical protein
MPQVKILKKPVKSPAPEPQEMPQETEQQEVVQPTATVSKTYPDGTSTETKEEVSGPIIVKPPMANVGVSMGMTFPTQPFANIKFNVSLFIPCAVDVDEINETYGQVKAWVDQRVGELSDEIQSQLDGAESAE